ncbi:hypothetical protein JNO54_13600 [Janibacter sp. YIM B02568]|uniref:hypothetical protein n=1 Tax=Janibacter endophyticus TaxID=2806261 RepID=UPI00194E555F|nr:hypothetical protein [Janibacter endophyticus]MBM6547167.1 hypothetical protein [Janibacter endophyticus]
MFDAISPYLATLLPTVGVAFLFYWIIKYMIEADRRERKALAAWRKEHDKPAGAPEQPAENAENAPSGAAEGSEEKPTS